jgi:ribosomal protein L37AE/L43A
MAKTEKEYFEGRMCPFCASDVYERGYYGSPFCDFCGIYVTAKPREDMNISGRRNENGQKRTT